MTPERFKQIEELYHAARQKTAEERAALLAQTDPDVQREVESLLAQRTHGEFLDRPAIQHAPPFLDDSLLTVLAAGACLGPYRLEGQLGEGGMGEVFRAVDTRLDRAVAIKIMRRQFSGRFEREARAIAALNHPNICTLYDVGPNYLVMELVEGETIASRLNSGPLSVTTALSYASQILAALAEAHGKGVVHRDLKPANIMIAKAGIKVLDFGLAKSGQDKSSTTSYLVMGTPGYMAPEQREGKPADARSDIYSFGCVLYEMLTGTRVGSRRKPLPSRKLETTVSRCLEEDPDRRWPSSAELERELASLTNTGSSGKGSAPVSLALEAPDEISIQQNPPHSDLPAIPAKPTNHHSPSLGRKRPLTIFISVVSAVLALFALGLWINDSAKRRLEISQLEWKGDFYVSKWTEAEVRKGIEYYRRAIALDPTSASAQAGLAAGWDFLSDLHSPPHEVMPRAKAAALAAVQLDDSLAQAHVALGVVKMQYDWDWAGAEREFRRAIQLAPEEDPGHRLLGWLLVGLGRFEEAQRELRLPLETDPMSDFNFVELGLSYYFARQYEQAIEQAQRSVALNPTSYWPHMLLGWAYGQQGHFSSAITELREAGRFSDLSQVLASQGHSYAVSGQRAEAQKILSELQVMAGRHYVSPYDVAMVYAGLGNTDETLAWLEKAYEDRCGWLALWLKVDPKFDNMRSDRRFQRLLQRIGHAS